MDSLLLKRKKDMMNVLIISSKNKKMKNEENICCPCEEIIEEILSHLPIESLIKCKFVSKQWNLLITKMFWYRSSVPKFGLLHQYTGNNFLSKLDFLTSMKTDEELDKGLRHKSKSKQIWQRNCCLSKGSRLLGSSNGLIVFVNTRNSTNVYYVCNPILHQWVMLPPPPPYQGDSSTMDLSVPSLGIAYDGIQGHHYKVIFKMMKSDIQTGLIDSKIFSSETGEWRTHQARIYNSYFLLCHTSWSGTLNQPSVYGKRKLYWTMKSRRYMLIFYLEMECFELVPLPSYDIDSWGQTQSGWIWESKGEIQYCYGGIDRLYLWTSNGDEDESKENWVLKHVIMHETLVNQVPIQYFNSIRYKPESFKMIRYCTFDNHLKVMYICMKGIVYSYSFESGRLKVAWQIFDNVWSVQDSNGLSSSKQKSGGGRTVVEVFQKYNHRRTDSSTMLSVQSTSTEEEEAAAPPQS